MDLGGLEGNLGGFLMETHPKTQEGVMTEHKKVKESGSLFVKEAPRASYPRPRQGK